MKSVVLLALHPEGAREWTLLKRRKEDPRKWEFLGGETGEKEMRTLAEAAAWITGHMQEVYNITGIVIDAQDPERHIRVLNEVRYFLFHGSVENLPARFYTSGDLAAPHVRPTDYSHLDPFSRGVFQPPVTNGKDKP